MDAKLSKARTETTYSLDWYHRAESRAERNRRSYAKRTWNRAVRRHARIEIAAAIEDL